MEAFRAKRVFFVPSNTEVGTWEHICINEEGRMFVTYTDTSIMLKCSSTPVFNSIEAALVSNMSLYGIYKVKL